MGPQLQLGCAFCWQTLLERWDDRHWERNPALLIVTQPRCPPPHPSPLLALCVGCVALSPCVETSRWTGGEPLAQHSPWPVGKWGNQVQTRDPAQEGAATNRSSNPPGSTWDLASTTVWKKESQSSLHVGASPLQEERPALPPSPPKTALGHAPCNHRG